MSGSDRNTETPSSFSVFTTTEKNFAITAVYQDEKGLSSSQLSGLVVGLGFLLIIICMIAFSIRQKARKNKQRAQNSQPRRSKSTIIPLCHWEVLPEQVVFGEEIGRGAFGRVLKGTFRESPGIEVFYKPRTQTVDFKEGRTVAIKVLGDTSDEEAKSQFLEEIEIMKAIGSHKNIVSMLGCWVHTGPIFLMLEYVPYGDLQHWLRNKRIQKSYQKNYFNEGSRLNPDGTELHFSIDSESKALLAENEEVSRKLMNCEKLPLDGTANKTLLPTCSRLNDETVTQEIAAEELKPDIEGGTKSCQVPQNSDNDDVQQDEDFIGKDLLCFAWQIARGMNFLSSKGFVHRDLAARNVLLGEDKVVKISDFGLMRQTLESVYKLKRGKKLPVKWTAPEALYNSEYTTKSDVWSFGILLWELCTMGGNPYPGINNKELYNLLKTGYRMEKPETCSDKLYQLVQSCWKEQPSERPTFESVTRSLEEMMQEDTPYLDFESLDESKAYYCNERLSDDDEGDTFL